MEETSIKRCGWLTRDPIYIAYHDEEWGKPEYNSEKLFEMICLECQQAGLSWLTVLKKRDNYRRIFYNFDPYQIVTSPNLKSLIDQPELLKSCDIIKHKAKINAIINNAECYIEMDKQGEDFSHFVWQFVKNEPIINAWKNIQEVPTQTPASVELSKALKKKGFKFVGPTICYAFMQACGLVNDHVLDCICYNKILQRLMQFDFALHTLIC